MLSKSHTRFGIELVIIHRQSALHFAQVYMFDLLEFVLLSNLGAIALYSLAFQLEPENDWALGPVRRTFFEFGEAMIWLITG